MGKEISFQIPQLAFLLLLVIPYFIGQVLLWRYRRKVLATYAASGLLPRLLVERSPLFNATKVVGWGIIWTLACFSLMKPFGNVRYIPLGEEQHAEKGLTASPHEVIFLADVSASMRVKDGYNGESRLDSAKKVMEDVLEQLHGETVSAYAFTSELTSVIPPTLDYIFARMVLHDLQIDQGDVGGTLFGPILNQLKEAAFPEPMPKRYTVLLFSDGGDTLLNSTTGSEQESEGNKILEAIPNPEELHLKLFTIGIGGNQAQKVPGVVFESKAVESKLEPEILEELAQRERGVYYAAAEWTSWDLSQELIHQINQNNEMELQRVNVERKVAAATQEDLLVDLYYQIPLGIALLFYLFNLLLPEVRRL